MPDDDAREPASALVAQAVLDALPSEVAVLDVAGVVVATNVAWEERIAGDALGSGAWVDARVDDDYLGVLGLAAESRVPAREALHGTGSVLSGRLRSFELEYSSRADGVTSQHRLSVVPLPGGVGGALVTHEDVTWRHQLETQLSRGASHDALTGLPNRLILTDRLHGALVRARRTGRVVAVMFLDLDHFKAVNDTLGHQAGDIVLTAVARRLERVCRAADTVTRFGGDEFVLVIEDVDGVENVSLVADRVLASFTSPIEVEGSRLWFSGSLGVAVASPDLAADADSAQRLLRDADTAMYRAKELGRNRAVVFEPAMRERVAGRLALTTALRQGIARDEFRVAYQPLFACSDDRVVGAEALVRWHSPERGVIEPGEFLAVAEEAGIIVEIGARVVDEVCRQAARWQRLAPADFRVHLNLSAAELAAPNAAGVIRQAIARHGLEPHRLGLDIREVSLTADPEEASRTLHDLLGFGVAMSIDDFGSGYSSLVQLRRFPVGSLKIDRYFVSRLPSDPTAVSLVRGIVALAGALGITTVAEGVETEEQRVAVAELGCDHYQGYLRARPDNPAIVTGLLERSTGVSLLPVPRS